MVGYVEFLYVFPWIFQKICIDNISSKRQKKHRLIAFNLVNTIPTYLQQQHLPFKQRGTTTIFSFGYQFCVLPRPEPFFWQNSCFGCNRGIDLVVGFEYTFFQICFNAEQIFVRVARFRRSYVKSAAVVLNNDPSYTAFLLDVRCALQGVHVPFFPAVCHRWQCICITYFCYAHLFLTKNEKMRNSYP